jgi:hypothetical protein
MPSEDRQRRVDPRQLRRMMRIKNASRLLLVQVQAAREL